MYCISYISEGAIQYKYTHIIRYYWNWIYIYIYIYIYIFITNHTCNACRASCTLTYLSIFISMYMISR